MRANLLIGEPFPSTIRSYDFQHNKIVTIGKGSYIGGSFFDSSIAAAHLMIGNYSSISYDIVFLLGMDHNLNGLTTYPMEQLDLENNNGESLSYYHKHKFGGKKQQIIIGHDVWIGFGCTIMGGVHIGNGACVAARSVVTKDVPPYAVVAGVPARIIKFRFPKDIIEKLNKIKWWYWEKEKINKLSFPKNVEEVSCFVKKYYYPDRLLTNSSLSKILDKIKQLGIKRYFISLREVDISDISGLLEHVFRELVTSLKTNDNIVLLIDVYIYNDVCTRLLKKYGKNELDTHIICLDKCDIIPRNILQNIDVLISTKEFHSLILSDIAYDFGVRTVYGYEDIKF